MVVSFETCFIGQVAKHLGLHHLLFLAFNIIVGLREPKGRGSSTHCIPPVFKAALGSADSPPSGTINHCCCPVQSDLVKKNNLGESVSKGFHTLSSRPIVACVDTL